MKRNVITWSIVAILAVLTIFMMSGCDIMTTGEVTTKVETVSTNINPTTTNNPTTAVNHTTVAPTTTNPPIPTTITEPKEEYQIIYIVDSEQYAKEFYYVEEESTLIEYSGDYTFSGWFKDYKFTDGPYTTYISYETDPIYFYGYTIKGTAKEAIDLINLIPDEINFQSDKAVIENARKYYDKLPEEEIEGVTNIDRLENAEEAILYQEAIYNTAYAYYYQGTEIDYDQYNQRRNMYAAPEDATSARELFLDCSSYVNSVYYNCFGVDIIPLEVSRIDTNQVNQYSKNYYGNAKDVLYYVETKNYTTKEAQQELLNEIKSILKPGDIINYRHGQSSGSAGHIMLYVGGDTILHCTGTSIYISSSTNPESFYEKTTSNEENFGAIGKLSLADVFTSTTSDRYLFKKTTTDSVYSFSILRPLSREDMEITESAISRVNHGILNIEKTSSIPEFTGVRAGDEITYTITIKNKSGKDVKNLNIYEAIPEGTTFVSSNLEYAFDQETGRYAWTSSILKGKTLTITYTVRVNKANAGAIIMDNMTYVDGVKTNNIFHIVEISTDYDKMKESIKSTIGKTYLSELTWMRTATGYDFLSDMDTAKEVLDTTYTSNELVLKSKVSEYIVKDLWGGYSVAAKHALNNDRIRAVMASYLECGDMIFTKTGYGQSNSYKYSGYIFVSNELILGFEGNKVVESYTTIEEVQKFLTTLYAYNQFVILRSTIVNN